MSPWVVVVADPRASVRWTPAIADKRAVGCRSCERPPQLANKSEADGVYELWAHGRLLLISGRPGLNTTDEYMGQQQRLATHLVSVIADTVRLADRVLPSKTPPFIGGQAVNNVLMRSRIRARPSMVRQPNRPASGVTTRAVPEAEIFGARLKF